MYCLIPPIFGLLYRYAQVAAQNTQTQIHTGDTFAARFVHHFQEYRYLAYLLIVLWFTNIVNFNIPYFFSLNIFTAVFLICFGIMTRFNNPNFKLKKYISRFIIFYILYGLIISWSVLPQISEMWRSYNSYISGESIWSLRGWISWQAMRFPEPFLMFWDYKRFLDGIPLTIYLNFVYVLVVLFYLSRTPQNSRKGITLLVLYVVFIFLANKGIGWISEPMRWAIFRNPVLASLRSFDKTLIYIPFLIWALVIMCYRFLQLRQSVSKELLLGLLVCISIVSSFPLWSGLIQKRYSMILDQGKSYAESEYSGIHVIPDDYYETASIINSDNSDFRILSLPYAVVESPGWVNYPKWKVIGADPTRQLFKAPTVQMNNFGGALGSWNYGLQWNTEEEKESLWLLNFASLLNVKYFIYHKDVKPQFTNETQDLINYYSTQGWIIPVFSGEYIAVYRLSERYISSHLYKADEIIIADGNRTALPKILNDARFQKDTLVLLSQTTANMPGIVYKYRNAETVSTELETITSLKTDFTSYELSLNNVAGTIPLVFSEAYHSGWILKGVTTTGAVSQLSANDSHIQVNGYANGWLINIDEECEHHTSDCIINEDGTKSMKLTLEFLPQSLVNVCRIISLTVLFLTLGYLCIYEFLVYTPRSIQIQKQLRQA